MREIQLLADRCRLSRGDMVWLAREAAGCGSVTGPEDLNARQLGTLHALLTVMAGPLHVDDYLLDHLLVSAAA